MPVKESPPGVGAGDRPDRRATPTNTTRHPRQQEAGQVDCNGSGGVTMSLVDAAQLAEHEAVIERGLKTFVKVGEALLAIRDQRLYRANYATFDEYCSARWGFKASRARQLIGASQTVTNVTAIGGQAPETESQARELAGLTPQQAAIVMRVAHENSGGNITAAAVRAARAQPWTKAEITVAVDGYRIHPGAACYPAFQPHEWKGLAESIGDFGLIEPIKLTHDGTTIVDGRFRYLALRWNGIDPATATTKWGEPGKPALQRLGAHYTEEMYLDYIVSSNIRLHLTDGQKACIAVKLEDMDR
jgi:hypothetical protein